MASGVVRRMVARGVDVAVERGAAAGALIPDPAFAAAGARLIDDVIGCDVVLRVPLPRADGAARLRSGAIVIGFLSPATATFEALERRGVTAFAVESIPRISRAQAMDALLADHARGLQSGTAGRRALHPAAADDDDRRRHDPAGTCARLF
jgi:H+-translocating NAD(P) transhydrogenase subunit alpha